VETQNLVTSGDSVLGHWGQHGKSLADRQNHYNAVADLLDFPNSGIQRMAALTALTFSVPKIPNDASTDTDFPRRFNKDQMLTPTLYLGTTNSVIIASKLDSYPFGLMYGSPSSQSPVKMVNPSLSRSKLAPHASNISKIIIPLSLQKILSLSIPSMITLSSNNMGLFGGRMLFLLTTKYLCMKSATGVHIGVRAAVILRDIVMSSA
jgi:hypothetical protein